MRIATAVIACHTYSSAEAIDSSIHDERIREVIRTDLSTFF